MLEEELYLFIFFIESWDLRKTRLPNRSGLIFFSSLLSLKSLRKQLQKHECLKLCLNPFRDFLKLLR